MSLTATRRSATPVPPRTLSGRLRLRLFGLAPEAADIARFGPAPPAAARERLEGAGRAFIAGYNAALLATEPLSLANRLAAVAEERRGFAYEGAGMALAMLDALSLGTRACFARFLAGPGADHLYMLHVGAGWAMARLRLPAGMVLRRLDPLLGWLAVDGAGFHQGYFHPGRFLDDARAPRLRGYAARAFDQGLGRSLWFAAGARPEVAAAGVARFAPERRGDLWSGLGLAAAYAGGAGGDALLDLRRRAGGWAPDLAQGAAFAAKARARAGNPVPHTDLACRVFCGRSDAEAAAVTDATLVALPDRTEVTSYERWRAAIRTTLGGAEVLQ